MDYIVAHLLRVLQETVEYNAPKSRLSPSIVSVAQWQKNTKIPIDETEIVEETVFRVMHTLLCTYNLRHMYWPELRALKTCCRVFEKLVEKKLPVLADHFEHHDLKIGLFALGWFQTCFLLHSFHALQDCEPYLGHMACGEVSKDLLSCCYCNSFLEPTNSAQQ